MRVLRIFWLNVGFYGALLFMTFVSIAVVSLPYFLWLRHGKGFERGEAARRLIWTYGYAWTKLLAFFVPVKVDGDVEHLPRPCIITPNHQSFFDAYCISFLRVPNVLFAVRGWPFLIPGYGLFMRMAGYLNTEGLSSEDILRKAQDFLNRGVSIVIYPEGTRSPDRTLQRFHAGAFHLAHATRTPVVPLCIDGTGRFLKKGSFLLRPASITLKMLPPLMPEQFACYGDEAPLVLRRLVKSQLCENLNRSSQDRV